MGLAKISSSQYGIVWSLRVHKEQGLEQNARSSRFSVCPVETNVPICVQHNKCLTVCVINAHLAISSSVEICRVGRRPFGNLVLSEKGTFFSMVISSQFPTLLLEDGVVL